MAKETPQEVFHTYKQCILALITWNNMDNMSFLPGGIWILEHFDTLGLGLGFTFKYIGNERKMVK